jgi:transcriptional regulator with XRE-family HTH domain
MIATEPTEKKTIHLGRNVQRTREILGMKQLTLADITGMSQQNISKLEQTESIPDDTLEKLAKGLGVSVEFIKNFNEEATVNIFSNTFQGNSVANANNCIFNPLEKWLDAMEEVKQLNAALLKEKDEKIALLERLLAK